MWKRIEESFRNIVAEVIAAQLLPINALLGEILMEQHLALAAINELKSLNSEEKKQSEEEIARLAQEQQAQEPISTSRPSWPRMKKMFEERDARRVIAEQQESGDFQNAGRIANKFNEEAARLEAYWRNKSVKE